MQEALEDLFENQDRIVEQPREYVLSEVPKAEDLERLCDLPFEVSIRSQVNGYLVLATGQEHAAYPKVFENREEVTLLHKFQEYKSEIEFHTHPGDVSDEDPASLLNRPSGSDYAYYLHQCIRLPRKSPMLIATHAGLVLVEQNEAPIWDSDDLIIEKEKQIKAALLYINNLGSSPLSYEEKAQNFEKVSEIIYQNMREIFLERSIPWNQAQSVIDQYMNPENLS